MPCAYRNANYINLNISYVIMYTLLTTVYIGDRHSIIRIMKTY